ncbi:hypothetical protein L204_100659 [Cryptococcus depauperatus]
MSRPSTVNPCHVLLMVVFIILFLPSEVAAWGFVASCRARCNTAYLSCMGVYGNVQICNVAARTCFRRCV